MSSTSHLHSQDSSRYMYINLQIPCLSNLGQSQKNIIKEGTVSNRKCLIISWTGLVDYNSFITVNVYAVI